MRCMKMKLVGQFCPPLICSEILQNQVALINTFAHAGVKTGYEGMGVGVIWGGGGGEGAWGGEAISSDFMTMQ